MKNAVKYGLVTQRVIGRLRAIGIDINAYYLFREGTRPHRSDWPELSAEFPARILDPLEIDEVVGCTPWATRAEVIRRLDKGHVCITLRHANRVAGHAWADPDEVNDTACDYPLSADEAYLYDAFIAPEHRGHNLAPYMRAECYRLLRSTGKRAFYSISDYFNTPAIRFKQKLNAEIIRLYLQIKLGRRQLGQWILRDYERDNS